MKKYTFTGLLLLAFICFSCNKNNTQKNKDKEENISISTVPVFNADSAYHYIQSQVDFGPRVPNTAEHDACGDYIARTLHSYGAAVTNQYADVTAYDGTILKARNIIGSFNPENKKRVALFAHWDTRPWADNDENEANHYTPILGANDGASGVGVLLEVARQIQNQQPSIGIDIIFFDAEDYGTPQFYKGKHEEDTWCLGSQYWAHISHTEGYNARFGILLDMVGGKNATFFQEGFSSEYASSLIKKVWNKAAGLGYGNYFINQRGGYATDDHLYVNRIAKIPTIDIIPTEETDETSGFGSFWHTVDDNMDIIDKSTLKAVGQTVMEVIYNEK